MGARWLVVATFGFLLLVAALLSDGTRGQPTSPAETGATDDLAVLVDWGLERFRRAGLTEPTFADASIVPDRDGDEPRAWVVRTDDGAVISLADDLRICWARLRGAVVLCDEAKRCMLHELAHVWIDQNVDAHARERFMTHTGAGAWDDPDVPWHARGVEQAAETLAWGLMSDASVATACSKSACLRRVAGFVILTGRTPDIDCERCAAPPGVPREIAITGGRR